jgi:hypothetical protein
MVKALARTCGVTGNRAAPLASDLRGIVDVPFDVALDVFANHDVPRYLGLLDRFCPGATELNPDCRGVLLSIVFNRGASFGRSGSRYAEMREIKACVGSGDLARIPGLIRSMQRLWSKTSGLHGRREREARLFEKGLAAGHPEQHARSKTLPAPVDPDVVVSVQTRLRELGYFDTGAIDGQLVPKGRTESAILAFRHEHGLPLEPGIDDELLAALARAEPRPVSEIRKEATAQDLREQGSKTIAVTDEVKGWAGKIFGSSAGLGITGARDAVGGLTGGLGLTPQMIAWIIVAVVVLAVLAGLGVLIWHVADRIEQRRVADYRTGKNT